MKTWLGVQCAGDHTIAAKNGGGKSGRARPVTIPAIALKQVAPRAGTGPRVRACLCSTPDLLKVMLYRIAKLAEAH
ncbi:hypothetical protein ABWL39_13535 [Chitinivorax sp. PXF-14]|uniref:hypothetical protein n=1 Tax=Chitinivorax sp. PXF-14 TaxID=3230488 RepID=UPI0034652FB4